MTAVAFPQAGTPQYKIPFGPRLVLVLLTLAVMASLLALFSVQAANPNPQDPRCYELSSGKSYKVLLSVLSEGAQITIGGNFWVKVTDGLVYVVFKTNNSKLIKSGVGYIVRGGSELPLGFVRDFIQATRAGRTVTADWRLYGLVEQFNGFKGWSPTLGERYFKTQGEALAKIKWDGSLPCTTP